MSLVEKSIAKWTQQVASFDRVRLGTWPTPVEPLHLLGVPEGANLWIKRDDLSSLVYGGNKVRKLEFLFAASKGTIITVGALGSHHVLATALHAATLGRECIGILTPQPLTPHVRQVNALIEKKCLRVIQMGRPTKCLPSMLMSAFHVASKIASKEHLALIAPGGSTPLGTLGYVLAGLELAGQVDAGQCPCPEEIYLPLGTGGTAAGLALGLALAGLKTEVIAVRVASRLSGNTGFIKLLAARTFAMLTSKNHKSHEIMPPLRVRISHDFIGKGYGYSTSAAEEAVAQTSLPLEITYSAKAMAALIRAAHRWPVDRVRMFLDTYGPINDLKTP